MPSSDDPVIGQILSPLLLGSHLMAPGTLADHVAEAARPLGVTAARIYLADLQQHRLRPMSDDSGRRSAPLAIDSTPAGRAFQTITMEHGEDDDRPLWIPLVEGVERLGVLELCFADDNDKVSDATVERCRILASLVGLLIASKGTYSDTYTSSSAAGRWHCRPRWSGPSWRHVRSRPVRCCSPRLWSRRTRWEETPSTTR